MRALSIRATENGGALALAEVPAPSPDDGELKPSPVLMPLPFLRRMHVMPKRYPLEQRERAIRMVLDRLGEYPSVWAASQALGPRVLGPRRWEVRDPGPSRQRLRTRPTSEELEEIKSLKAAVRDLKQANETLKSASIFFARELDRRHR